MRPGQFSWPDGFAETGQGGYARSLLLAVLLVLAALALPRAGLAVDLVDLAKLGSPA